MENNILEKNEKEANKLAAIITLVTIAFIVLVYMLNVVGIFIVDQNAMSIAMGIAALLMLLPAAIVFGLKQQGMWVKYVIVIVSAMMVAVLNMLLSWHIVLLFLYPMAIGSIYFSRRLSWFTVIFSIVLFSGSQIASLSMGGVHDKNLESIYQMIVYGILPRSIALLAISLIFIVLSKRTKNLLQNVVGAEEEKQNMEKIVALTDKSYEVSNVLAKSVKELTKITVDTKTANEEITEKTSNIVDESNKTIDHISKASSVVMEVSGELNKIAKQNTKIAELTREAMLITEQNFRNMKDAAGEMKQIDKATNESKTIISKLSEKSNEIANIADVIKNISTNTNLLALNASIEAARAGEQGKGFAVVASNIRELAEQSQNAANSITDLIATILEDTNEAVKTMDLNTKIVNNGITYINKAEKSSIEVNDSIDKVNSMAISISSMSEKVADNGEKLTSAVEEVSKLTNNNIDELKSILTASKDQLTSMNEVAAAVNSINSTAEELSEVVKKTKMN